MHQHCRFGGARKIRARFLSPRESSVAMLSHCTQGMALDFKTVFLALAHLLLPVSNFCREPTVDDFVVMKASKFNGIQQPSDSGLQFIQQQAFAIHRIQSISIGLGIWFATRGSEVQIPPVFVRSRRFNRYARIGSLVFKSGSVMIDKVTRCCRRCRRCRWLSNRCVHRRCRVLADRRS